jgi:hypothetical protein
MSRGEAAARDPFEEGGVHPSSLLFHQRSMVNLMKLYCGENQGAVIPHVWSSIWGYGMKAVSSRSSLGWDARSSLGIIWGKNGKLGEEKATEG